MSFFRKFRSKHDGIPADGDVEAAADSTQEVPTEAAGNDTQDTFAYLEEPQAPGDEPQAPGEEPEAPGEEFHAPGDESGASGDESDASGDAEPVAASPAAPTRRAARAAGRRRRRALVATAGIVALVGAGGVATAAAHKTVELDVNGQTREVSTFTRDVEGLLANEGIELAEHDLVVPGPEEGLRDGAEIVVRTAQQVAFQVDGQFETLWTTSLSADEALAHLNASGRAASLTASRSADGRAELAMPVTQGGTVRVLVDDSERVVEPRGPVDLESVLRLAEVELRPADRVTLDLDEDGTAVLTIVRVEATETTRTETIEHDSIERETSDLFRGQSRVVQEGADGERTYTMAQVLADGEVESTKHVSVEVTTEPQDRIVEVGTAERPAPQPQPSTSGSSGSSSSGSSGSGSGGSGDSGSGGSGDSGSGDSGSGDSGSGGSVPEGVWAQLAQCESGGNPSIVSSNGLYHGLYQFRVDTWRSVGGSGLPSEASPAEQTKRAQILQQRSGWGQWPACARQLGLL